MHQQALCQHTGSLNYKLTKELGVGIEVSAGEKGAG
jgi:hypothetical protein